METSPPTKRVNSSERDLLVFTHIPKTAGITFKRMLDRQFPRNAVAKVGPDYQGSVDQIKSLSPQIRAGVRCVIGHVPYGIHQFFDQKEPRYVSFVRHPVDRAVSEYFFFVKQPQLMPLLGLDAGTRLNPQEFWAHQASIGMVDFQTRVLSGYDNMVDSVMPPYKAMNCDNAASVIDGIISNYAFIGTVEQFDACLLLMQACFGWQSVRYISRNVGAKGAGRSQLKQECADEIRRLNPLDCQLYDRVCTIIDQQIAEQGDDFTNRLERFRRQNKWYARLWSFYRSTGLRRLHMLLTHSKPKHASA